MSHFGGNKSSSMMSSSMRMLDPSTTPTGDSVSTSADSFLGEDILAVVIDINPYDWQSRQPLPTTPLGPRRDGSLNGSNQTPTAAGVGVNSSFAVSADAHSRPTKSQELKLQPVTFRSAISAVLQLMSACFLGWPRKTIILLSVDSEDCVVIFKGKCECGTGEATKSAPNGEGYFDAVAVASALVRVMERAVSKSDGFGADSLLSFALSKALCMINGEIKNTEAASNARIFLLDTSPEESYATQYPSLMNVAFAAVQQGIRIDICSVGHASPPAVVQQLSDISGGTHLALLDALQSVGLDTLKVALAAAATPTASSTTSGTVGHRQRTAPDLSRGTDVLFPTFLMFHFLPSAATFGVSSSDSSSSSNFSFLGVDSMDSSGSTSTPALSRFREAKRQLPTEGLLTSASSSTVNYSVVCCCHRKAIDLALVCSSCLAIFCADGDRDICTVCKSSLHKEAPSVVSITFPSASSNTT